MNGKLQKQAPLSQSAALKNYRHSYRQNLSPASYHGAGYVKGAPCPCAGYYGYRVQRQFAGKKPAPAGTQSPIF